MRCAAGLLLAASRLCAQAAIDWETPRNGAQETMLVANGDLEAAVWTEPGGEILLDLRMNGALDEKARPRKLARLRLRLTPDPSAEAATIPGLAPFRQHLRTSDGFIDIGLGNTSVSVWVDVHRPVVRVEVDSPLERTLDVALEDPAGTVAAPAQARIVWHYRNRDAQWPASLRDLGVNRTFGGAVEGTGLASGPLGYLRSAKPSKRFLVNVHGLAAQTPTAEAWRQMLDRQIARTNAHPLPRARAAHIAWWQRRWQRSHIHLATQPEIERAYSLQRYANLCAGRGEFPIAFDAFAWPQFDLAPYWAMLAAGDFEMMLPLLRFYGGRTADATPELAALLREYRRYTGASLPPTLEPWLLAAPEGRIPETAAFADFDTAQPSRAMWTLQRMLVRSDGDKPEWLNGWPKQWDSVRFRVFLPGRKTAEGEIAAGTPLRLKIDGN